MKRRERLMATLRGEPVDRPAVSFYEVGGFKVDPDDPDPFNIYHSPDWRPLLRLAESETDLIRMMSPVRARSHDPVGSDAGTAHRTFFRTVSREEGDRRIERTTATVAGRTLTRETRREKALDTVWVTEPLLKDPRDLDAYLEIPDEAFAESIDAAPLVAEEKALGDKGIVMIDTEDPLCAAAGLFGMENFLLVASTEGKRFHRLLEKAARRIQARTERVSRLLPGRLWRIYGPEYATAPYLPPDRFQEYVVRYDAPMIEAVHRGGGYARVHAHGNLEGILDAIAGMGADALDPIEPPPMGDVSLRRVRERYGKEMVLFGNLEIADIENLPLEPFVAKVRRALEEGTAGEGRGFVLMPSASPCGRRIASRTFRNYEKIIELVREWV